MPAAAAEVVEEQAWVAVEVEAVVFVAVAADFSC